MKNKTALASAIKYSSIVFLAYFIGNLVTSPITVQRVMEKFIVGMGIALVFAFPILLIWGLITKKDPITGQRFNEVSKNND